MSLSFWICTGLAITAAACVLIGLLLDDSDPIGWGSCPFCGRKHK